MISTPYSTAATPGLSSKNGERAAGGERGAGGGGRRRRGRPPGAGRGGAGVSDLVCVKRVKGKGRGVFARQPICRGTLIEKVPVIIIPNNTFVDGEPNPFRMKYFFAWSKTTAAMVLGYGSIYNHSFTPNARYEHGPMVLSFRALRDIEEGEEITINYNFTPDDPSPVGFDVK